MTTLNHEFNAYIADLRAAGIAAEHTCDKCGCDMAGMRVVMRTIDQVCEPCAVARPEDLGPDVYYREDFHADG